MTEPERGAPPPVPEPRLPDLLSRFLSRTDELLGYLAEAERRRELRDQRLFELFEQLLKALGVIPEIVIPAPTALISEETKALITEIVTQVSKELIVKEIVAGVIARPTGALRDYDSKATSATYQTVAKLKPTQGMLLKLTKILVSCTEDVVCKLRWQEEDIGPEITVMANLPFTDWFPYNYRTKDGKDFVGDGNSEMELQVKYPSGGSTATCFGELCADEVLPLS